MMIKRQTVERMVAAYPSTRYKAIHAYPLPPNGAPDQYALFDCMIDSETGDYLSEDFTFCRLWRALGGKIWLDREGALTHCGAVRLPRNAAARFGAALRRQGQGSAKGRMPFGNPWVRLTGR
ncbi:MAG: hypothetical protein WDN49_20770 [Acetobacteraceae bacterium]